VAAAAGARVLADSVGPGGTAAIVVFALILAVVVIILAMLGSLKRLRQSVSKGTFQRTQAEGVRKHGRHEQDAVTPDQGSSGGAGA
jgi:hypothetical protein